MNIVEYKTKLQGTPRQTTLCFLTKEDEILLAMKKRGFGEGKWNGVGGKQNPGEDILKTAIRETFEEIEVTPVGMELVAVLNFYFLNNPEWNQQCSVYITKTWEGEPKETEEMRPQWYNKKELPFEAMWPDDKFWIPLVLNGTKVNAEFMFDENNTMLESNVVEVITF